MLSVGLVTCNPASGAIIVGIGGINPFASAGENTADLPGGLAVTLGGISTAEKSATIGDWDTRVSGSSRALASVATTAAQVELTTSSLEFNIESSGLLGDLVSFSPRMTWAAKLGMGSLDVQPNTQYEVTFDVSSTAGFLSNVLSGGKEFTVSLVDDNDNPIALQNAQTAHIDLLGLFGEGVAGQRSLIFTTGDTVTQNGISLVATAATTGALDLLSTDDNVLTMENISIEATPVPEPSSAALLCVFLLGFLIRRRVR